MLNRGCQFIIKKNSSKLKSDQAYFCQAFFLFLNISYRSEKRKKIIIKPNICRKRKSESDKSSKDATKVKNFKWRRKHIKNRKPLWSYPIICRRKAAPVVLATKCRNINGRWMTSKGETWIRPGILFFFFVPKGFFFVVAAKKKKIKIKSFKLN